MDLNLTQYIKPELLVLIPVLMVVGAFLKRAQYVWDENIPLYLGLAGVVLALCWVLATAPLTSTQDVFGAVFTAAVQGLLAAGAAVYGHQLYKQANDKTEGKP